MSETLGAPSTDKELMEMMQEAARGANLGPGEALSVTPEMFLRILQPPKK